MQKIKCFFGFHQPLVALKTVFHTENNMTYKLKFCPHCNAIKAEIF